MKNKEIEELLNRLKDNDDWYIIENKEEHNTEPYKLLLPTERDLLLSYIEQLENNKDKAIEYIETKFFDGKYKDELLNKLRGDSDV